MSATTSSDGVQGLRRWAKGVYPLEAAVELLVRAFGGRFARVGYPWVAPGDSPDAYWLDVERLTIEHTGVYSGGERRLLALAASLAGGEPVNLYEEVPGLDRDLTALFLAAVAHATRVARSQQHPRRPRPGRGRHARQAPEPVPVAHEWRSAVTCTTTAIRPPWMILPLDESAEHLLGLDGAP